MPDAPAAVSFQPAAAPDALQRLAVRCAALAGWRRSLIGFLLGTLAAAALPPFGIVPLLVPAFSGLAWLAEGCRGPRAFFLLGWSFGFGFFLTGLYWIAISMFVDITTFWWAVPFAVAGLPFVLAAYSGLALLAYGLLRPRGVARACILGVAWAIGEWLRGHLFTGFPWNLVGYAWAGDFPGDLAMLQTVAVTGIYGLSLLTVVAAALPAGLGDVTPGARPWRRWMPPAAAILLLAALAAFGAARLAGAAGGTVPGVVLRLVQPAIAQTLKWEPAVRESNFQRLLALSRAPAAGPAPTDIIWPEAAATYWLNVDAAHRQEVAAAAPKGGLVLTGALRTDDPPTPPHQAWNSLLAIDGEARIVAAYDKFHLVPFGEYMPFRAYIPIPAIAAEGADFSSGPGPRTLDVPGLPPVSPLICYEAIFPGEVVDPAHRPGWLLNITNDAWFGFSSGPFQHFAIARTRAVEEGLPLVRAANNGISGVVDALGRVQRRLGLDETGTLDSPLPAALAPPPYARFGDAILAAMLLVFVSPLIGRTRSSRRAHADRL
jgi:apolipoprotein N-acyltransferase